MRRAGVVLAAAARSVLLLTATALAMSCGRVSTPARSAAPLAYPSTVYLDQFDSLWTRFQEVYPSFEYKGVDWREQRARFRPRAAQARSQDELVSVLLAMLAPLRDLHVWLVDPRGQAVPSYRPPTLVNFDRRRWESAMRDVNYIARASQAGDAVIGGYGYLWIGTWKSPVDSDLLDLMLQRAKDAPGLIIDVRTNAGGSDAAALAFASRFTQRSFTASYVQLNIDPRVRDLEMPLARTIGPRGTWQFTRPVVIIAGRGGFSATESFVAAMRTMPQVTVIGDTTGGASGNPATYALGKGWQFTVPRWLEFAPDKQPIEWRGVAPQIAMAWRPRDYDARRDPLIDAAVGLLGERTGVYRIGPLIGDPSRDGLREPPPESAPRESIVRDTLVRDPLSLSSRSVRR
ncbi:MAG: hypothetical protein IBJ03_03410 [Gemmatimonadaceae bacterium]|nr:hypothetical protein [Gemmatimonadaceae bacterium]